MEAFEIGFLSHTSTDGGFPRPTVLRSARYPQLALGLNIRSPHVASGHDRRQGKMRVAASPRSSKARSWSAIGVRPTSANRLARTWMSDKERSFSKIVGTKPVRKFALASIHRQFILHSSPAHRCLYEWTLRKRGQEGGGSKVRQQQEAR